MRNPPALRVNDDPMVLRENARLQSAWNADIQRRVNAIDLTGTITAAPMQVFKGSITFADVNALGTSWPSPAQITLGTLPPGIGLYTVAARLMEVFVASSTPYTLNLDVLVGDIAGADYFTASLALAIANDGSPPTVYTPSITPSKLTTPTEPQTSAATDRELTSSVVVDLSSSGATPDLYTAGRADIYVMYHALWHPPV